MLDRTGITRIDEAGAGLSPVIAIVERYEMLAAAVLAALAIRLLRRLAA